MNLQDIVDASSAGFTKCPVCNKFSVNEKGWCYNGCGKAMFRNNTKVKQRWTNKEVVDRMIESAKNHWYHISMNLKEENGWKNTWQGFERNWREWDNTINNYWYALAQIQQYLDITDEEFDALLKEA